MLTRIMEIFVSSPEVAVESHDERVRIATCVLLLETATANFEFSPDEGIHIIETLRKRFRLSQDDAEELLEVARQRRGDSFDLWKFTNQINLNCSIDEKVEIIEEIWRVSYVDGSLDGHEDYLAHKLGKLLNLTHRQVIDAKVKAIEEMTSDEREN